MKIVKASQSFQHNGREIAVEDQLALRDEDADALIAAGRAVEVAREQPPAPPPPPTE